MTDARRPNVLYILADDLGWGDVGFHGSDIRTPNVDCLRATGVELNRHYVCPMCTPTRACLMTGRHPGRFGRHATVPSNAPVLPDGYVTLATAMQRAGYHTGLFGKWHLGSDPAFRPNEYGFDHSYGSLAGGVDPYNHCYKRGPFSRTWHRNGEPVDERGHVTDLITDEAVRWLHARPADEPWLCYVPYTAVHVPVKVPQHWLDEYWRQEYDTDRQRDLSFKRYAAYTTQMDHCIGRLIDVVQQRCELADTLIVFASDNGAIPDAPMRGVEQYPGLQEPMPRLGSNAPLRGRKGQLYDGGVRTPCVANWAGTLAPGEVDQPVHATDWMPTLCGLAGAEVENAQWDGADVWPVLAGRKRALDDREIFWNFRGDSFGLLRGDWKLIARGGEPEPDGCELFNLADDPYEQQDRAAERNDLVTDMLEGVRRQRRLDGASKRPDADDPMVR